MLLLLFACEEAPSSDSGFTVTPETIAFGPVALGASSEQVVIIRNLADDALELTSLTLVQGEEAVFSFMGPDGDSVAAGDSQALFVLFVPTDLLYYDGQIQLKTSAGDAVVQLDGAGTLSTEDLDSDGFSPFTGDCNDDDPTISPAAAELCDGVDGNCDGTVPHDESDDDSDGWMLCELDCDDTTATAYPGAPEVCDDADSDCDGVNADRVDADDDGASLCDGDCNDEEAGEGPFDVEVCDGLDNDCSGAADDLDADGDGVTSCDGDCDEDPASQPIFVDLSGSTAGDGSLAAPFDRIADGLEALDSVCPNLVVGEGVYEETLVWDEGEVSLLAKGLVVISPPGGERAWTVAGGAVSVLGVTFSGGSPAGDGGAVSVEGASFTAIDSVFSGNGCTGSGGAIAVNSGTLRLDGVSFADNLAGVDGGAVAAVATMVDIADSEFVNNAAVRGGGLLLDGASGGVQGVTLSGNRADSEGGGLAVIGGSALLLSRLTVWSNEAATRGGGISFVDLAAVDMVLRKSTVLDNTAGGRGGGVAYSGSSAAGVIANTTLGGNIAAEGGAGIDVDVPDAMGLYLWSNVLLFNDGPAGLGAFGTGASVAYTVAYATSSGVDLDLDVAEDGGDNLIVDPRFADFTDDGDPANDDVRLSAGSPCRNSGPQTGGPSGYDWLDADATRNDRGSTGGQE